MGTFDSEHDKRGVRIIGNVLKKRGLIPDFSEEWEIHGPHRDMNYQVYIGWAYKKADTKAVCICPQHAELTRCCAHKQFFCVAIYPEEVYEIEDYDRWCDVRPEDRILIQ